MKGFLIAVLVIVLTMFFVSLVDPDLAISLRAWRWAAAIVFGSFVIAHVLKEGS